MKITLTRQEVEEALFPYLAGMFKKHLEDLEIDAGIMHYGLDVTIHLGSEDNIDEPEEENTTEDKPVKRRRRRKTTEQQTDPAQIDLVEEVAKTEPEEPIGTHYANLPKLTSDEQQQYTQVLSYLSDNPRNKNRLAIEELVKSASGNLTEVLNANEHFKDWLKYCEDQDAEKIAQEVIAPSKPEPEIEPEEDNTEEPTQMVGNVLDDITGEVEPSPSEQGKSLFGNPDPSVNKSGSMFNSQGTTSGLFGSKKVI